MGRARSELQEILKEILGSNNVYFQPPPNIQMQYPCIIYKRDYIKIEFASNDPYFNTKRYLVTIVDRDPDSMIHEKIASLPMCTYNRFFAVDDLNHDIFTLFF